MNTPTIQDRILTAVEKAITGSGLDVATQGESLRALDGLHTELIVEYKFSTEACTFTLTGPTVERMGEGLVTLQVMTFGGRKTLGKGLRFANVALTDGDKLDEVMSTIRRVLSYKKQQEDE